MNSLAHSSDWVGKEIEVKPHKFDGDERSLESLRGGRRLEQQTKRVIRPAGRLQERCYWEKNKHHIVVLRNKNYTNISSLRLQLLQRIWHRIGPR